MFHFLEYDQSCAFLCFVLFLALSVQVVGAYCKEYCDIISGCFKEVESFSNGTCEIFRENVLFAWVYW